jgi:hypothetical protein
MYCPAAAVAALSAKITSNMVQRVTSTFILIEFGENVNV